MKLMSNLWISKICCLLMISHAVFAAPVHGVSLYGEPKYPEGFSAFAYVNENAPKGGVLKQATYSAFDTLNPFVINGVSAPGIGLTYDTLMKSSEDEPFTLYGLVAETIDISDNRRQVIFQLNEKARFSDGTPITAEDVIFSFNILREKGVPMYRAYYRDIEKVEAIEKNKVIFYLSEQTNRELPLILGELPVLSKNWWQNRDFEQTSLDIPVSSGPYQIKDITPGRRIVYQRRPDYWAKDLNVNKGSYNFDEIHFDVYRDTTVAVEAFKAGLIDIRLENEAKKWQALKESDVVQDGRVQTRVFAHQLPAGMQGFVFNLRRPIFKDILVREAIGYAFDFKWTNKQLFYGAYHRTSSFFENSEFKSAGLPDEKEWSLLEPLRDFIPASVFTQSYQVPGQYRSVRDNLQHALKLLYKAGCSVDTEGTLRLPNGQPFRFEILLDSASGMVWERVVLPFKDRLKKLGIEMVVRTVDSIQYKNRLDSYDFDMVVMVWGQSFAPGNEQRYFWGSQSADSVGGWNYAGIKNSAVDTLIERIVSAETQEEHRLAVKALDRVLLHMHFVIPNWYTPDHRYLFWDKFGMPDIVPMKGMNVLNWWYQEKKENK